MTVMAKKNSLLSHLSHLHLWHASRIPCGTAWREERAQGKQWRSSASKFPNSRRGWWRCGRVSALVPGPVVQRVGRIG